VDDPIAENRWEEPEAVRGAEDEAAFGAFFADAWGRLQSQAYVLTGSRETAQDLTQEAFLRAWKRWDNVAAYDSPEAWTRKVLHNLCIGSWRKKRRKERPVVVDNSVRVQVPDDHYELAQAMKSLPGKQARALLLHDGLGFSTREVATELGVPEGTVKSWLSRGRKVVADRLDRSRSLTEVKDD
jgi:RNA polymerase sigma-70 factor (ECF subfamily)